MLNNEIKVNSSELNLIRSAMECIEKDKNDYNLPEIKLLHIDHEQPFYILKINDLCIRIKRPAGSDNIKVITWFSDSGFWKYDKTTKKVYRDLTEVYELINNLFELTADLISKHYSTEEVYKICGLA